MSDTVASTLAVDPAPSHPRSRRRLLLRTIVGLAVLLVIVRLLLPWLLARAINDRLGSLPLHQGVVDDVEAAHDQRPRLARPDRRSLSHRDHRARDPRGLHRLRRHPAP